MIKSDLKLGDILVNQGIISTEQLRTALAEQSEKGGKVGEILVNSGVVNEKDIAMALSKQFGILYASLEKGLLRPNLHQELEKLIPEEYARMRAVLPLSKHLRTVTIAVVDPLDLIVTDDIMKMTACDVNIVITTKTEIVEAIDAFYKSKEMQKKAIQNQFILMDGEGKEDDQKLDVREIFSEADAAPIVKFVDLILMDAVEQGASDIHIEHFEERVSLRYRVDGVLYEANAPDAKLYFAIVSRIKILSKLDIAERRLPQDGGFSISLRQKTIDVRVSTIPTIFGEKVCMRLLDVTKLPLEFGALGYDKWDLEIVQREIGRPYGMIFITGPTGSGKSTSLYTILNAIKSPRKNIVTVEDPVEYKVDGINQVQVKPLIGMTFANALRAFLRQDPDVMMVGEVRDLETAQMCIRAALTGHLVLSTLHTNDAPSAITRIMDVGIEPFLLVSALRLVIAQRLLRRLCEECKKPLETLDVRFREMNIKGPIYEAKGCDRCRFSGYRGRVGIYELLPIVEEIRNMIYYRKSSDEIKKRAVEIGMRTLYESGLEKMKRGMTTFEEVLSVTVDE
ncbi:MAG: Flp pilus assembly complex ATPase component TadA [Candidatus Omnitrophica bacterium]|nr:Flp pilus assembly complex ATPase component TadA [Candidatus Omnitrophota bacterium]